MTKKGSITVNKAVFSDTQESTYSVEQLLGNLQPSGSKSDWLDGCIKQVTINEVGLGNVIIYKVRVNNIEIDALYDTGVSIRVMSKWFFHKLPNKPKLIQCNRNISGAGEALISGECFIQLSVWFKKNCLVAQLGYQAWISVSPDWL